MRGFHTIEESKKSSIHQYFFAVLYLLFDLKTINTQTYKKIAFENQLESYNIDKIKITFYETYIIEKNTKKNE